MTTDKSAIDNGMHLERPLVFEFNLFFLLFFFYFVASQVALVVPNPSATGFMASQEAVITRVAALGRGATTTGFKRFLALTEASKYKKNGPSGSFFIHNEEWN
ncbi:Vacuolar protein sorting-associated protein A [Arachis hypogaea]|nr:Vacuolar protein sorting-associated protein A [Arachis hypogaea]